MREIDLDVRQPMDLAYREAEDSVDDALDRAARRSRLLRGIEAAGCSGAAVAARPAARALRPWGGWLVAAGLACLAVLVGVNVVGPGAGVDHSAGAMRSAEERSTVVGDAADAVRRQEARAAEVRSTAKGGASVSAFPDESRRESANAAAGPAPAEPVAPAANAGAAAAMVSEAGAPARAARMVAAPDLTTDLHALAASGNTSGVVALVTRGVPVDARSANGNTALMTSLLNKRYETARVLLDRGASLDVKNQDGVSAREMMISSGDAELADIGMTKPK